MFVSIIIIKKKKDEKPFSRTKPSTLSLLKESVKTKPPRKALREVENVLGGVMGAKLACDLPRNRKQVKNLKYNINGAACTQNDVLAHVMQVCKVSWLRRSLCSKCRGCSRANVHLSYKAAAC